MMMQEGTGLKERMEVVEVDTFMSLVRDLSVEISVQIIKSMKQNN